MHRVGKFPCHHLAFTQETVDWEIWIDAGDRLLPRKLTIVYRADPGEPRYNAVLTRWQVTHDHPAGYYEFRQPRDAERIDVMPIATLEAAMPSATQPATEPGQPAKP